MTELSHQIDMITQVAKALGDLLDDVVFVGGCVTGLLINDAFTLEQVRFTDDVDLIVNIITHADWNQLQSKLRSRGFKENMEDTVICRVRLAGLKVDIMPIKKEILGFTNQWYQDALKHPLPYKLGDINVNIISPVYYVATKLEAFEGRGNKGLLSSHDIEDVVTLFDGRAQVINEINTAEKKVQQYICTKLNAMMTNENFEYVIQGVARGNLQREQVIINRIEACLS
jgi:predicted nucleotidyltransferase